MKTSPLLLLALSVLLLSNCESARIITSQSLRVQGAKLRKTTAFRTQILQVGTKVSTGTNSFSPYDFLRTDGGLPAMATTALTIDEVSTWLAEIGLSATQDESKPDVNESNVSAGGTKKEKGTFAVVAIQTKRPLLDLLQSPENRELVDWLSAMPKGRIITAVATTKGHQSVRSRNLDGSVTANLTVVSAGPGSGTVHLKSTRNSTLEFSDGTVFAYEMSIPAWSRYSKGRLYIADLVEDRPGTRNPRPSPGTYLDPTEVP